MGGEIDDDNVSVADSRMSDRDVSMEVAEQVLNTSRSMRQVHSSRSIRGEPIVIVVDYHP